MKNLVRAMFAMVLFSAVVACVGSAGDKVHVKCPACGYEFETSVQN